MAISNFIPTIWSENLYSQLDKKYIAVNHCNRDYEGEIKEKGSVVNIVGVGSVSVFDYTKDTDMSAPQTLSDTNRALTINQAKAFNFQIDDIDRAQCTPKLMNEAMKVAANALANAADSYVFSLYSGATTTITEASTTTSNIITAAQDRVSIPLSDPFPLSERLVAPASAYLAAMLVLDTNETLSDKLFERYSDSMSTLCSSFPALTERIIDIYGF